MTTHSRRSIAWRTRIGRVGWAEHSFGKLTRTTTALPKICWMPPITRAYRRLRDVTTGRTAPPLQVLSGAIKENKNGCDRHNTHLFWSAFSHSYLERGLWIVFHRRDRASGNRSAAGQVRPRRRPRTQLEN